MAHRMDRMAPPTVWTVWYSQQPSPAEAVEVIRRVSALQSDIQPARG